MKISECTTKLKDSHMECLSMYHSESMTIILSCCLWHVYSPLYVHPLIHFLCRMHFKINCKSFLVAQQAKDPALSLPWLGLLLWYGFDPRPGELLYAVGMAKTFFSLKIINCRHQHASKNQRQSSNSQSNFLSREGFLSFRSYYRCKYNVFY